MMNRVLTYEERIEIIKTFEQKYETTKYNNSIKPSPSKPTIKIDDYELRLQKIRDFEKKYENKI